VTENEVKRLYSRTLIIIIISQIFGGMGLAAGVTVGALMAQEMLGADSYAGVPVALITLGSAVSAYLVGRLTHRYGRRVGLSTGFLAGSAGAVGIVLAGATNQLSLLLASLLIYGAGTSTNLQARYAGTDLAKPEQRAKAVSLSMVSTTLGAVAGPNLVRPMGDIAVSFGLPALTGPFLLSAAAFALAGLILFAFLRPDPYIAAKAIAAGQEAGRAQTSAGKPSAPFRNRGLVVGTTVMVLT